MEKTTIKTNTFKKIMLLSIDPNQRWGDIIIGKDGENEKRRMQ